jgi:hypothetical protein
MVLIPRKNIESLSFEIDLKYGMNVGRCEHPKRTIQLLKRSKLSYEEIIINS